MEFTGALVADQPTVAVSTRIAAPPERVWRLVSDPTLMPDCSPEVRSVRRLEDGPIGVGSAFVGHSRHEALGEWSTTSHVVECTAPRVFAWAVQDVEEPTATWRFTLEPDGDGTTVTFWVRMGPGRSGLSHAIERMPDKEAKIVFVRLREFERNMTTTLATLKSRAENVG